MHFRLHPPSLRIRYQLRLKGASPSMCTHSTSTHRCSVEMRLYDSLFGLYFWLSSTTTQKSCLKGSFGGESVFKNPFIPYATHASKQFNSCSFLVEVNNFSCGCAIFGKIGQRSGHVAFRSALASEHPKSCHHFVVVPVRLSQARDSNASLQRHHLFLFFTGPTSSS